MPLQSYPRSHRATVVIKLNQYSYQLPVKYITRRDSRLIGGIQSNKKPRISFLQSKQCQSFNSQYIYKPCLDKYKLKGYLCMYVSKNCTFFNFVAKFNRKVSQQIGKGMWFSYQFIRKVSIARECSHVVPATWPMAKVNGVLYINRIRRHSCE